MSQKPGVDLCVKLLDGSNQMPVLNESTEQLDEISKETLGSYIEKKKKKMGWEGDNSSEIRDKREEIYQDAKKKGLSHADLHKKYKEHNVTRQHLNASEELYDKSRRDPNLSLAKVLLYRKKKAEQELQQEEYDQLDEKLTPKQRAMKDGYRLVQDVRFRSGARPQAKHLEDLRHIVRQTDLSGRGLKTAFDKGAKAAYYANDTEAYDRSNSRFDDAHTKIWSKNINKPDESAGRQYLLKRDKLKGPVGKLPEGYELTPEDLEDFLVSEEYDQLDEISKETLKSYTSKARNDILRKSHKRKVDKDEAHASIDAALSYDTTPSEKSDSLNNAIKRAQSAINTQMTIDKRYKGVNNAVKRLTKEDVQLEDYSIEDLEDFLVSEEYEQLDEISKETLKSYIGKARGDKKYHQRLAADETSKVYGAYLDAVDPHSHKDRQQSLDDLDYHEQQAWHERRKASNRAMGIQSAKRKMNKLSLENVDILENLQNVITEKIAICLDSMYEQVSQNIFGTNEDYDQLDEYVHVTTRGNTFTYRGMKDALDDGHPAHAKVHKKGQMIGTVGTLSQEQKQKQLEKKLKKEEVELDEEQLDEISKTTLKSYLNKASQDAVDMMDKAAKHRDIVANAQRQGADRLVVVNKKAKDKAQARVDRRVAGAVKASRRLAKEDFEELDEARTPSNHTIEAYGVKGMKSTRWRKSFKHHDHLADWADKNDAEVHGVRDLDGHKSQPTNEEFEQLDELTGKTLGSYIQKAHAADAAKRAHGVELDADPRVQKVKAKTREYMNNKKWKQFHKSIEKEGEVKRKIDPDYPKSISPTHRLGIEKASDRLRYGNKLTKEDFTLEDFSLEEIQDFMVSEDYDQLDELSKNTLVSYITKAHAKDKAIMAHGNALETHPHVLKVDAKISEYMDKHPKMTDRQFDNLEARLDKAKKKVDPNYPQSTYPQHSVGIRKAAKRLANK